MTYGSFTIDAAAQLNNQVSMINRNIKVENESNVTILPDYTETADWGKVQNPYFGDKMMTCGVVKTTIDKDFKNPVMKQASNARPQGHNH